MTTTIAPTDLPAPQARPAARQRFSTLLRVELRKATDTRSGRSVLAAAIAVALAALIWKLFHTDSSTVRFDNFAKPITISLAFILPVVGLLAMTSEWTQRTALTTFTTSPRRLRVMGAKFASALTLSVGVLICAVALTFGFTALGGVVSGAGASYGGFGDALRGLVVASLLQVTMGAAFGALIPITAAAIGVFFAAPTVWTAVAPNVLGHNARWLDVFEAYDRLGSTRPGQHVAETITAITAWVIIPAAIGLYRAAHREVK